MNKVMIATLLGALLLSACPTGSEPEAETHYAVTFTAGAGTGAVPEERRVTHGAVITLPGQGGMTATEQRFVGWETNGRVYAAGASFTVTGNTTLESATYQIEPGAASLYKPKKNTNIEFEFPSGVPSFEAETLYIFVYDGKALTLSAS